jgi:glycosyltransferase involved in cell wall biosynthesis
MAIPTPWLPVRSRMSKAEAKGGTASGQRPRRILFVTTSMVHGGAQRQVVDLAIELRTRGWVVAVLSMIAPSEYVDDLIASSVEIADLGMTRGRPTLGALLRYRSFVRRWQPDIVHSHMVHANLLARIGRVFAPRTPLVCTVHTVMEGRRWRAIAYRLTDRLASATTAVSAAAAERSIRNGAVPRSRMTVIPNGFEFSRASVAEGVDDAFRREVGIGDDAFLWATVGRLVPEKGHPMLLRAVEAVRRVRPDARLAIVGDGPERSELDRLVLESRLHGTVFALGERRDVAAILAAADAFVLSSYWEGLPMVLLEAAAQSLPIVSTDVGGCREVVRPELGGVLTERTPEAIAAGMLSVMNLRPGERAAIGFALRTLVQSEFDMGAIVARWEALYTALMTAQHSR